jgi:Tfp pilus assembly protein FimT
VTFVEILFATALIAIVAGAAIPSSRTAMDRARAWSAARYLSGRITLARVEAVRRSAYVALRFEQERSGVVLATFVDGNRNGVRTDDILSHTDASIGPATRLSDLFPGVTLALSDGPEAAGPTAVGSSRILSFSPLGGASSGTVYVRGHDGSRLAVRVLGATGRTRILRYVPRSRTWIDAPW